ncbi:MAG: fibronectin type III domain-containing protein [Flavobacteriales bacterium]|nr:fibronectin type III domain-containing protein [Flavobacteriales bacterium]MCB9165780.1 fibronectin type III domain-containing protein [Flavobacteriales bacterium]
MKLVKTDLRGLNALQMLMRARIVRNCMKDNPLFPAPTPTMPDFEAAIDALNHSVIATHDGGSRGEYIMKQQNLEQVATMIKSLATYVSFIAQGDALVIADGGFEQRRASKRINSLAQPKGQRARSGPLPRTIDVRWDPVHGARMYKLHINKGYAHTEGETRFELSTKSRCRIEGLDPLEYYTIRVQAIGTRTNSPLSGTAVALSVGMKAA